MINSARPAGRLAALVVAGLLVQAGCGSAGAPAGGSTGRAGSSTITVLAAASLTGSFTQIGRDFEAAHPGRKVRFSFGSSATLATQITQGAPADVFAAASPTTMTTVTGAGAATGSTTFASNTLEIAVPAGNPGKITGLADFADADQTIALCAPVVPCGAAAAQVFQTAGITPKPDTLEADVKAALAKVAADEVDAALVYTTDVRAGGTRVEGITFPEAASAVNDYPIVTLNSSKDVAAAQAFVDYVLSPAGQSVLTEAGFGRP